MRKSSRFTRALMSAISFRTSDRHSIGCVKEHSASVSGAAVKSIQSAWQLRRGQNSANRREQDFDVPFWFFANPLPCCPGKFAICITATTLISGPYCRWIQGIRRQVSKLAHEAWKLLIEPQDVLSSRCTSAWSEQLAACACIRDFNSGDTVVSWRSFPACGR